MVSQAAALDETLEVLALGPEHAALVGYCRGLAEALDLYPERASLWREYRPALELLAVAGEVEADDGQADLLRLVSAPVGDAAKAGTANSGAGGRGGRSPVGSAVDAVAGTGRGRRTGTTG